MVRDKILILCDNRSSVNEKLETLFKQSLPVDQNIIKSIKWKNKYYDVEFDLYIDELTTSLEDWIKEFNNEEYDILRDVLAGIIFILPFDDKDTLEFIDSELNKNTNCDDNNFDDKEDEGFFMVCCDPISNEKVPYWNDFTKLEVTTLTVSQERNNDGEYEGIKRIEEIIDVYPWSHSQSRQQALISETSQHLDLKDTIDMQGIISKLKLAKLEYSKNKDESMALEISEEMSKLISDAI
ncbi:Irc6p PWA37_001178 [Arxiozyma heterogenica]|uniref:Increased recombination centers protein 6 n=1 Tax=Arxiozyma heterogenica TaxID=278026 RepID=A0AAN8A835_9SACH|nr:hypothetical protein RI543_003848 [Kazachstania heterogenica]